MTGLDIKMPKLRHAMSVYVVRGSPESDEGGLGTHRSMLFLLPLNAEVPDARDKFLSECGDQDGVKYTQGRIESVQYVGWVWLPEKDHPSWTLPSILADIEKLTDAVKQTSASAHPE